MDHHINKMSKKIIDKYIIAGRIVGTNADGRHYLQKYAMKHQYFGQKGDMMNCPMCNQPDSRGSRWMAANNITILSMSKRPRSRMSSNKEQCYVKYDRNSFHEHPKSRMNFIYHKLDWEFDEMGR